MNANPGDLVVCVDDSPCTVIPYCGAPFGIKRGAILRVEAALVDVCGYLSYTFAGLDFEDSYGFHASLKSQVRPNPNKGVRCDGQAR